MVLTRNEIERAANTVISEKKNLVGENFKKLLKKLKIGIDNGLEYNHRRLLVISGGSPGQQGLLAGIAIEYYAKRAMKKNRKETTVLYMYHDEYDDARIRKETFRQYLKNYASKKKTGIQREIDVYEKTEKYLGTTYDSLVLDLNNDLKPNDMGRLVEIVRGGGLIVFLVPEWRKWDTHLTIFKQKLLVPGYTEPKHVFLRWVKTTLMIEEGIYIYDACNDSIIKTAKNRKPKHQDERDEDVKIEPQYFSREIFDLTLTGDQKKAVNLMEKLVPKPKRGRKTVLVVTADRGRGKSCALGIGLIGIADALKKHKHKVRIIVTAPSPANVQSLFMLAIKTARELGYEVKEIVKSGNIIELQGPFFSLEYWEPIVVPRIRGDIIAVDEASGIHVPLLMNIYHAHDRIIFTATIHGYEGAGRGFSIRFLGALRESQNTDLETMEMKTPIRYAFGDPIEKWLYRTLLLDAEPAELTNEDIEKILRKELEYIELESEELFTPEHEEELRMLFGIYVLAHYRNQPDDLGMLADAPHHVIRAIRIKGTNKIVGSLQIAIEGSLDKETVETLLRGNKIPGNIIPDRILKHLRIWEMGYLRGYRIVRIATHPKVQDKGIGSYALEKIYEEAREKGLDWVGSGFGINYKLLKFWVKNGFYPIHMSPDRNPVSGEYTTIVFKPITEQAVKILTIGSHIFRHKLLKSLRDTYKDLETDIALLILESLPTIPSHGPPQLTDINIDRLWIYSYGPMTYEALSDVMWDIALYYFLHDMNTIVKLSNEEKWILLSKALQGKEWEALSRELGQRDKQVMLKLKEITRHIIKAYYNRDLDSPIGIKLEQ